MKKVAIIYKEKFAIAKAKKIMKGSFAHIQDENEITIIIEQSKLKEKEIIKVEKNYRLITFDMILPFNMVGFISKISNVLAKEKIPIFVISAYSTDHLLIKDKYSNKTINILEKLGFEILKKKYP